MKKKFLGIEGLPKSIQGWETIYLLVTLAKINYDDSKTTKAKPQELMFRGQYQVRGIIKDDNFMITCADKAN